MKQSNDGLEQLKKDPRAAGLLKDSQALGQLLSSPDTQRLMELLRQQSGGNLEDAAARGDVKALSGLVHRLMESREGADLVRRISRQAPGGEKTP